MSVDRDVEQLVAAGRVVQLNSPERCRRPMAEESARAACEDGGHPTTAPGQLGSTKREYTAANGVQATRANPMLDRLGMPSELEELAARDNAMLIRSQLPDSSHGLWSARVSMDTQGVHKFSSPPRRHDYRRKLGSRRFSVSPETCAITSTWPS